MLIQEEGSPSQASIPNSLVLEGERKRNTICTVHQTLVLKPLRLLTIILALTVTLL